MTRRPVCCVVCGAPRGVAELWFQLVENRWTDRLKILRFQEAFSPHPGVYSVCCEAHVRELVVHWMTTGNLDFPFARLPHSQYRRPSSARHTPATVLAPDPPTATVLGELAVHRESLTRLLQNTPEALSSVLEALIAALHPHLSRPITAPTYQWARPQKTMVV